MTARPSGTSSPTPRTDRPPGGSGRPLALRHHLGLGVDQVHRGRAPRLVLPAHLPGRSVPDSFGQHGEHPADRGLPVRQQGAVRRGGPPHPHPPSRRARAAPERHPGVRLGRGRGTQGRQAADRHAGRHAVDGGGPAVPERPAGQRALRGPRRSPSLRGSGPAGQDAGVAGAAPRAARHRELPARSPGLGPDRGSGRTRSS